MRLSDRTCETLYKRLRYIEGQARGVQRMIEESKDAADILVQLMAIASAARRACSLVLEERTREQIKQRIADYLKECPGPCPRCTELEELAQVVDDLDFDALLQSAVDLELGDKILKGA